jgi:putative ABC transport system substrate-binding protein
VNLHRRALLRLAAWPIAAMAGMASGQPRPAPARIGWLGSSGETDGLQFLDALRQGLRELGYVEGRNLVLDARWGDDSAERIGQSAAELVAARPDVIVTQGPAALTVRKATTVIPVVFGFSGDPVEAGFVKGLAQPGGNLTGISYMALDLVGKRIELLREVLPRLKRIAVVAWPQHPGDRAERRASETAAASLGIEIEYFEARGKTQLEDALNAIPKTRCEAVLLFPVSTVIGNRVRIAEWALKHRRPTVSGWAQFAEGGNLLSYGPNLRESSRRLAAFVDRILRGSKPAEIPVELPTRVELAVNLRAARALGVVIPQTVLLRADRVID